MSIKRDTEHPVFCVSAKGGRGNQQEHAGFVGQLSCRAELKIFLYISFWWGKWKIR